MEWLIILATIFGTIVAFIFIIAILVKITFLIFKWIM